MTELAVADPILSLPPLLNFLTGFPDANRVLSAVRLGALGQYNAWGSVLWRVYDEELVGIAVNGHEVEHVHRWTNVKVHTFAESAKAARSGRVRVRARADVITELAQRANVGLSSDLVSVLWHRDETLDDDGGLSNVVGYCVTVPIIFSGEVIGVLGAVTKGEHEWSDGDNQLLNSVGSALGLWMHSTAVPEFAPVLDPQWEVSGLKLSSRQQAIMRLVAGGCSNLYIATKLGYSVSTIKQEVARVMARMSAPNRTEAAQRAKSLGLLDP